MIKCECNNEVTVGYIKTHLKTKMHERKMEKINKNKKIVVNDSYTLQDILFYINKIPVNRYNFAYSVHIF